MPTWLFFLSAELRNGEEVEAEAAITQGALLHLPGARKLKAKADLGHFTALIFKYKIYYVAARAAQVKSGGVFSIWAAPHSAY